MKTMLSQRGKTLLLCENNFKYSFLKKISTGETIWRCAKRACPAKIYTLGDALKFSKRVDSHHHDSIDDALINRQMIKNGLKRKAEEDLCQSASKLIDLEIKNNEKALNTLTNRDIQCMTKSINRSQQLITCQKLPKNAAEPGKTLKIFYCFGVKN